MSIAPNDAMSSVVGRAGGGDHKRQPSVASSKTEVSSSVIKKPNGAPHASILRAAAAAAEAVQAAAPNHAQPQLQPVLVPVLVASAAPRLQPIRRGSAVLAAAATPIAGSDMKSAVPAVAQSAMPAPRPHRRLPSIPHSVSGSAPPPPLPATDQKHVNRSKPSAPIPGTVKQPAKNSHRNFTHSTRSAPPPPPLHRSGVVIGPSARVNRAPSRYCADVIFKYQTHHVINFEDLVVAGFFDGGRGPGGVASILDVEAALMKKANQSSREVLLVDPREDVLLTQYTEDARVELLPYADLMDRCTLLAEFVSGRLGGAVNSRNAGEIQKNCESNLAAMIDLTGTRIVRLGEVVKNGFGLGRHRALLFKYLCDQTAQSPNQWIGKNATGSVTTAAAAATGATGIDRKTEALDQKSRVPPASAAVSSSGSTGTAASASLPYTAPVKPPSAPVPGKIKCRLIRGAYGDEFNPRAWNEILVPDSSRESGYRIVIIDLMRGANERFVESDSVEGQKYHHLKPNGEVSSGLLPVEDPLYINYDELLDMKLLGDSDQGAMSYGYFGRWRGRWVFVKREKNLRTAKWQSPPKQHVRKRSEPLAPVLHRSSKRALSLADVPTIIGAPSQQQQQQPSILETEKSAAAMQAAIERANASLVAEQQRAAEEEKTAENERFLQHQFDAELKLLTQFRHKRVVSLLAVCEEPLALVMERVEGGDLYNYLRVRRAEVGYVSWADKQSILIQIADGLCAMHKAGIVHRDLKPANILWSPHDMSVKIGDYGLARFMKPTANGYRAFTLHAHYGTLIFMAPEQIRRDVLTAAADVYGFAGIMYWLITDGFHPWYHISSGVGTNVLNAHKPPFPRRRECPVLGSLPRELHQLMFDCMHLEPTKRPTMEEVMHRLREMKLDATNPIKQNYY